MQAVTSDRGGAVGHGQGLGAVAEELDELADDFLPAQDLGDGQYQVSGGHALAQPALQNALAASSGLSHRFLA
jgi:hypothetical protein